MKVGYLQKVFHTPKKVFNFFQTLMQFCLLMGRLARFSNPQYQSFRKIIKDLNSFLTLHHIMSLRYGTTSKLNLAGDKKHLKASDSSDCCSNAGCMKTSINEPLFITNRFNAHFGHSRLVAILIQSKILQLTRGTLILLSSRLSNNWLYENYLGSLIPLIKLDNATVNLIETMYPSKIASIDTLMFTNGPIEFNKGIEVVQQTWNSRLNQPLLKISNEDLSFGLDSLQKYGFRDSDWFVSLSTRNSSRYAFERNCESGTFIEAIQMVLKAGGWVFHMGKFDTQPINFRHRKFVNLLDKHCERLDVFLLSAARFHIGAASGISEIPNLFGVPTLWTNVPNLIDTASLPNSLVIPKLTTCCGEPLSNWERSLSFGHHLESERYGLRDNTPDEIAIACKEMLDGASFLGNRQNELVTQFQSQGKPPHRISEYFLSKHSDLITSRV